MTAKVYVTNMAQIAAKYGDDGATQVRSAIDQLVSCDASRGLTGEVIDLSEPGEFTTAVTDATDDGATKAAIDERWNARKPDYLVLVGGLDIIGMQQLANPQYSPGHDDDRTVPSDLPYACDAAYATEISAFRGPTRVVGRLPDETDEATLDGFLSVIGNGCSPPPTGALDDNSLLAMCALEWDAAARVVLSALGVTSGTLHTVPPAGPNWSAAEMARPWHWVSCHGGNQSPLFAGQHGPSYPTALDAALVEGQIQQGTVMATGCCYGAQLYSAPVALERRGMAMTYLLGGAASYLGSTTIAYGSDDKPTGCDRICQYYLDALRSGRSSGAALLDARQRFIAAQPALGPTDLKTIAQFVLYGDPSASPAPNPAIAATPTAIARRRAESAAAGAEMPGAVPFAVADSGGATIGRPSPRGAGLAAAPLATPEEVTSLIARLGFQDSAVNRFSVPLLPRSRGAMPRGVDAITFVPEIEAFYVSDRRLDDAGDWRGPAIERVEVAAHAGGTLSHTIYRSH